MMAAMNNASKSQQSQKNNLHHRHPPRASGALTNLDSELALLTDPHPLVRKDSASSASYAMGYTGLSSQHRNLATSFDLSQNPPHHQARPRHPSNPSSSAIPSYPISSYSHPKKSLSQSSRSLYGDCGSSDGLMLFGANNILADDAIFPGIAALDFDSVFSGDGRASQPYDPFEMHDLMAAERTSPKKSNWNPGTDVLPAATLESMSFESVFEYPSLDTDLKRKRSPEPSNRELVESIIATVESSNLSPSNSPSRSLGYAISKPSPAPLSRRTSPRIPPSVTRRSESLLETSIPPTIVNERVQTLPTHSTQSPLHAAAPATLEACLSSTSDFRDSTRVEDVKPRLRPSREISTSSLDDARRSRGSMNIPPKPIESFTAIHNARARHDASSSRSLRPRSEVDYSSTKFPTDMTEYVNLEITAAAKPRVEPPPPPPTEPEQRIMIRIASPKVPAAKVVVSEPVALTQWTQETPAFPGRRLKIRLKTANSVVNLRSGLDADAVVREDAKFQPTDLGFGLEEPPVAEGREVVDAPKLQGLELESMAVELPVGHPEELIVANVLPVPSDETIVLEVAPLQREEPVVEVSPLQREDTCGYLPFKENALERQYEKLRDTLAESDTMPTEAEVSVDPPGENLEPEEVVPKWVDVEIGEGLQSEVRVEEFTYMDGSITVEVPAIQQAPKESVSSFKKKALRGIAQSDTRLEMELGILDRTKDDSTIEGGLPETDLDVMVLETAVEIAMPNGSANGLELEETGQVELQHELTVQDKIVTAEEANQMYEKVGAPFAPENVEVESASIDLREPRVALGAQSRTIPTALSDAEKKVESALEATLDTAIQSDKNSSNWALSVPTEPAEIIPEADDASNPLCEPVLTLEAELVVEYPIFKAFGASTTDVVKLGPSGATTFPDDFFDHTEVRPETVSTSTLMDSANKTSNDLALNVDISVSSSDPLTPDIEEATVSPQPAINALPTPATVAAVLPSKAMTTSNGDVLASSLEERAGDVVQLAPVMRESGKTPALHEHSNQHRSERAILEERILEETRSVDENTAMAAATMTLMALDALQTPPLPPAEIKTQQILFGMELHLPETLTAPPSTSAAEIVGEPTSSPRPLDVSNVNGDDKENLNFEEASDMDVDVVDLGNDVSETPAVDKVPKLPPAETLPVSEAALAVNEDEKSKVARVDVEEPDSVPIDSMEVDMASISQPVTIDVSAVSSSERPTDVMEIASNSIPCLNARGATCAELLSPPILDSEISPTADGKATSSFIGGSSIWSEGAISPTVVGAVLSPSIPGTGRSPSPAVIETGYSPAATNINPNVSGIELKSTSVALGQSNKAMASAFRDEVIPAREGKRSSSETTTLSKDSVDRSGRTDALVLVAESRTTYVKTERQYSQTSLPVDTRDPQGTPLVTSVPAAQETAVSIVNDLDIQAPASMMSSQALATPVLSSPVLVNSTPMGPPKKSKRVKRQIWAYVPILPEKEEKPIDINEGRSLRTRAKQEPPDADSGREGSRSKRLRTGDHSSTLSTPSTRSRAVEETESPRLLRVRLKLQGPAATGPSDLDSNATISQPVSPVPPRMVPENAFIPKLKLSVADVTGVSLASGSTESVCKVCFRAGELLKCISCFGVWHQACAFKSSDAGGEHSSYWTCNSCRTVKQIPTKQQAVAAVLVRQSMATLVNIVETAEPRNFELPKGLVKGLGRRISKSSTQPVFAPQLASALPFVSAAQSSLAASDTTSSSVTQKVKIRLPQPKLRMYATVEDDVNRPAPGTIPANTVFRISEKKVKADFVDRIRQANLATQRDMTSGVRKQPVKLTVERYQRLLELEKLRNDAA